MKKSIFLILVISVFFACQKNEEKVSNTQIPEKITFPSLDSVPIVANLYRSIDSLPVIVLCHQAGLNKIEYVKIAETLYQKGYNCIAIDQRSGGHFLEWCNETMLKAVEMGKPVDYLDAEKDIVAAVDFATKKYKKKIILWGSSYSASLALFHAIENENIEAVISFSPGDYFGEQKQSLKGKLIGFNKPMFVTSSKEEAAVLTALLEGVKFNNRQTQFIPNSKGAHGSSALWQTNENNKEYWIALNEFLDKL